MMTKLFFQCSKIVTFPRDSAACSDKKAAVANATAALEAGFDLA
jgi:hypothetical protein